MDGGYGYYGGGGGYYGGGYSGYVGSYAGAPTGGYYTAYGATDFDGGFDGGYGVAGSYATGGAGAYGPSGAYVNDDGAVEPEVVVTANPQVANAGFYSIGNYTSPGEWSDESSGGTTQTPNPGVQADPKKAKSVGNKLGLKNFSAHVVQLTIAGKQVSLYLDDHLNADQQQAALARFSAAAQDINDNLGKLSSADIASINNITSIVASDQLARSGTVVKNGLFGYASSEFNNESTAYIASNILHDGSHVSDFQAGRPYTGDASETRGWQAQVGAAAALGLNGNEVNYLNGLIANPASQHGREGSSLVPH